MLNSPVTLSRQHLAAYALLAVPLAFLGLPLYVYLPAQYAAMPEIGLALSGLVLMGARLLDLFTDPVVGSLVDRYRHRLSYRAVILAAAPLLVLGVWMLFVPPDGVGPAYLFVSVSLTYLAWTLMSVPYYAWGAELGTHRGGQVRVAAWREGGVILGMLLALIAPLTAMADSRMEVSAWWMLLLLLLAMLVIRWVPMSSAVSHAASFRFKWLDVWRDTATETRKLLALHFLNTLANGIPATLFLLYAERVLGLDLSSAGLLLLVYFLCAIAALPFWSAWARRHGRAVAWRHAVLLAAFGFLPAAFLGHGDAALFLIVCIITGACAGADIALPAAIQASLAQHETIRLERPRSAALFGLWGMVSKLALAIAVGISFPLLGWLTSSAAGFDQAVVLPILYAGFAVPVKLLVFALLQRAGLERGDLSNAESMEVKHVTDDRSLGLSSANSDGRL